MILLDPSLRKQFDQIHKAKAETLRRMREASADRQAFLKDLERREREFLTKVEQTFQTQSSHEQMTELDLIIKEAKD